MTRYTQKALRTMAADGTATDITHATDDTLDAVCRTADTIGYSHGTYGCNWLLLRDRETYSLYVITSRSTSLFRVL